MQEDLSIWLSGLLGKASKDIQYCIITQEVFNESLTLCWRVIVANEILSVLSLSQTNNLVGEVVWTSLSTRKSKVAEEMSMFWVSVFLFVHIKYILKIYVCLIWFCFTDLSPLPSINLLQAWDSWWNLFILVKTLINSHVLRAGDIWNPGGNGRVKMVWCRASNSLDILINALNFLPRKSL